MAQGADDGLVTVVRGVNNVLGSHKMVVPDTKINIDNNGLLTVERGGLQEPEYGIPFSEDEQS